MYVVYCFPDEMIDFVFCRASEERVEGAGRAHDDEVARAQHGRTRSHQLKHAATTRTNNTQRANHTKRKSEADG